MVSFKERKGSLQFPHSLPVAASARKEESECPVAKRFGSKALQRQTSRRQPIREHRLQTQVPGGLLILETPSGKYSTGFPGP